MYHILYYYAHKLNVPIYFTALKIHLFYSHIYSLYSLYIHTILNALSSSPNTITSSASISSFIKLQSATVCHISPLTSCINVPQSPFPTKPFSTFFNRILSLSLSSHSQLLYLSIVLPHLAQLLVLPFCTINYQREPRTQFVMPSL